MSTSITTDRRYVYRASSSSSASSVSSVLTAPSLSHSREPGVMAAAASNTVPSEQQEENNRNPFRSTCEHSELIAPPPAYVDAANMPPPPSYVAVDMSLPTPADTSQTAATTRSMPTDADWTNTTTTATRNGVEHNNKALDDALDDLCFCCSVLQCIDLLFACCIGLAK